MTTVTSPSVMHGPAYQHRQTLPEALTAQADRTPEATALSWRGRQVSYGELVADAAAIRSQVEAAVARVVGGRQNQPTPVAVRMRRGPLLVATLLAILQTGAPYLALPTQWPRERCRQAMAQAGARVCLVDDLDGDGLPGTVQIHARHSESARAGTICQASPASGCAVFHTSGTSGLPKAVLSPHSGIVRVADDPRLAFDDTTRTLQAAPVGWDAFSLELWAPLLRGGSSLLHDEDLLTPAALRAAITAGVNTVWLTASLFHAFVDEDPECLRGLRLLMTGGERLSTHHVARFRELVPDVRLLNGYGPVEATVFVSAQELDRVVPGQEVPIGTPIAGTSIYLLGDDRRPVPVGSHGEIAVAGDGLALGYLGDPDATRESFPTLPLGPDDSHVRVYLTGDLGRIDESGVLEFLGRRDRQVKIRGVRVDPAEVERVTETVDGVVRTVVVPLPLDAPRKEQLAAFCTVAPGADLSPDAVRTAVADALPRAFVPTHICLLPVMPVTPNGKTDVRALVAQLAEPPAGREPEQTTDGYQPAGAVAELVAQEVTELLGRGVAAQEDPFLAGATSVTAIRLSARLDSHYQVRLSAGEIMRARTPSAIADLLQERLPVA